MHAFRKKVLIPAFFFTTLGIANALAEKLVYEQEAIGSPDREIHKFVKPFFFAVSLFFGVSMSLFLYIILSFVNKEKYPPIWTFPSSVILQFFYAGFFDLFQGVMSSITCALVGVSIDYMMRSSTLVGVTLIARFYFKKHFRIREWVGITIVTISLLLVGLSSVISADSSATIHVSKKIAAIIMVVKLISQATYSIGLSIDQFVTQQKRINVMAITGIKSFFSFLMGAIFVIPFVNYIPGIDGDGIHEDFQDTLAMLKNNTSIIFYLLTCLIIESVYQISSVSLTNSSSAVVRTLVESFRTFLLWLIQLFIFYGFKGYENLERFRGLGEEWTRGSWLQLFGYCLLLCGLMIYSGVRLNDYSKTK